MRIVFTGAQGTGKTTILNHYKDLGFNVITEVVRNLSKKGVKINKDGDEKGQTKIFNEYKKLFNESTDFISDRCLVDVVAYTVYLHKQGKITEKFVNKQLKELHKFVIANPNIFYCYFPIEFDPADDGVRDVDTEFQKDIDETILSILGAMGLNIVIVNGSVEDRIAKVDSLMKWSEMANSLFVRVTHTHE